MNYYDLEISFGKRNIIGYVGENDVVRVIFDVKEWEDKFGTADSFVLTVQTSENYPVPITYQDGKVYWVVENDTLAQKGFGAVQLTMLKDEQVKKSAIAEIVIKNSLETGATPPEPYESWVEDMTEQMANINENIDTLDNTVTGLSGRMTTAEGDIDDLEDRMTTAEGDIDDLEAQFGNVHALWAGSQSDYDDITVKEAYTLYFIKSGTEVSKIIYLIPYTDTQEAYSKQVPQGATICNLSKIGGKSVVFNQLQKNGDFAIASGWSSNSGTLSIANGVATVTEPRSNYPGIHAVGDTGISYVAGHMYFVKFTVRRSTNGAIGVNNKNGMNAAVGNAVANVWTQVGRITTATNTVLTYPTYFCTGETTKGEFKNIQWFDLTDMFGSGNEPTLEECEEIFVNDYYDYNEGELYDAKVTKVTIDDTEKAIPATIQALDGYGRSAGSVYNYLEWKNGKVYFHKCVESVDLGTLTWNEDPQREGVFYAYISKKAQSSSQDITQNGIICSAYEYRNIPISTANDKYISDYPSYGGKIVYCRDTSYSTAADFQAAMSGVYLYYELAEEVVTDVTEYFADDFNVIPCADGDYITFYQEDIHLPVPNEEVYNNLV